MIKGGKFNESPPAGDLHRGDAKSGRLPDSVRKGDSKCNDEDLTPSRFYWARAPGLLYRAIPFASASSVFRVFCGSACSWLCWAGCLNQRRRPNTLGLKNVMLIIGVLRE